MGAEVALREWRRAAARAVLAEHAAEQERPLLEMLPELRRTAVLSFHQRSASLTLTLPLPLTPT